MGRKGSEQNIEVFFKILINMDFKLVSDFKPKGDQPNAIRLLTEGLKKKPVYRPFLELRDQAKPLQLRM
jgi:hypothetical protein